MPSRFSVGERAGLGELAGDAADLDHRQRRRERHHHGHLQEHAEEVADVVGAVLGEALGAIAAMEEECLAGRHPRKMLLQAPRLACKNQRRKGRELLLDLGESGLVRVVRHLQDRLAAPAVRRPTLGHDAILLVPRIKSGELLLRGLIHETGGRMPRETHSKTRSDRT